MSVEPITLDELLGELSRLAESPECSDGLTLIEAHELLRAAGTAISPRRLSTLIRQLIAAGRLEVARKTRHSWSGRTTTQECFRAVRPAERRRKSA